jgi:hypothetical protein
MKKFVAISPDRGKFQVEGVLSKKNNEPLNDQEQLLLDMYLNQQKEDLQKLFDKNWQENNLEYDLRTCEWICEKVKQSDIYAQNLYAALCNNEFQRLQVIPILTNKKWSCSWRYAGGIIAHMKQVGDYIDWYCSGIPTDYYVDETSKIVAEGTITDEILQDLQKLGWTKIDNC